MLTKEGILRLTGADTVFTRLSRQKMRQTGDQVIKPRYLPNPGCRGSKALGLCPRIASILVCPGGGCVITKVFVPRCAL